MSTEFIMPKLGLTMEEGTILEWLVEDGAEITAGMPVLRIETDKVESDVESPASGRFHRLGTQGEAYPCGALIGYLLADGEEIPVSKSPTGATPAVTASPTSSASPTSAPVSSVQRQGRQFASPNARRVAEELGIDINTVIGTGPDGRVVSEDVEEAHKNPQALRVVAVSAVATVATATTVISSNGNVLATAAARQLADLLGIDLSQQALNGHA